MKGLERDTEKEREQEVWRCTGERERGRGWGGRRERERELLREGAALGKETQLGEETHVVNLIKNLRVRSSLLLAPAWHSESRQCVLEQRNRVG
jgi:hypothetical protein